MSLFPKILLILRILFGFMQKNSYLCKGIPTIYPKRRAMAKKKILFINQEVSPYMADNELSLMGHELSRAMQDLGHEIPRGAASVGHEPHHQRHRPSTHHQSGLHPVIARGRLFHRQ